jgi:phosphocarrier protein
MIPQTDRTQGEIMPERTVTIASSHGLHARPASLFTQAAAKAGVPVQLTKGEKSVNAASILGVISLGIDHNDEVVLSADGDNAEAVLDELATLLATDHDAA